MALERREFIWRAACVSGSIAIGGVTLGALHVQKCRAREARVQELMAEPTRLLGEKADDELDKLPNFARQEMRDYFQGVCLNVHGFIEEISSERFAEKLSSCSSDEQKHLQLNIAFSQRVATGTEVTNRVEMIANETGRQIDLNWQKLCNKLTDPWQNILPQQPSNMKALDIASLAAPYIVEGVDAARRATYPIGQRPAISTTGREIGKAAILLLPVGYVLPQVGYPVFVLAALKAVWSWFLGRPAIASYQTDVSERLAMLGNRVGVECQQELRKRIADLQHWQENALWRVARDTIDASKQV